MSKQINRGRDVPRFLLSYGHPCLRSLFNNWVRFWYYESLYNLYHYGYNPSLYRPLNNGSYKVVIEVCASPGGGREGGLLDTAYAGSRV